jgi:hypothetical protein
VFSNFNTINPIVAKDFKVVFISLNNYLTFMPHKGGMRIEIKS